MPGVKLFVFGGTLPLLGEWVLPAHGVMLPVLRELLPLLGRRLLHAPVRVLLFGGKVMLGGRLLPLPGVRVPVFGVKLLEPAAPAAIEKLSVLERRLSARGWRLLLPAPEQRLVEPGGRPCER